MRGDSGARLEVWKTGRGRCVPEIIQPRAVGVRDQGSDDGQGEELLNFWTHIAAGFLFENACVHLCILVLVSPGLCCSDGIFSACGGQASHRGGFSGCRVWVPVAQAQWSWRLVAPRHVGSSPAWDRTHVSCISKQILIHCTTGKPQDLILLMDWLWDVRERTEEGLGPGQLGCEVPPWE